GKPIVGQAVFIAIHQAVHGQATTVNYLQNGFQGQHTSVSSKRVVLTNGVSSKVCTLVQGMCLTHFSDLSNAQSCHAHLSELGEVQNAIWVEELLPCHG